VTTPAGGWELRRGDAGYPSCLEDSLRPPAVLYGYGDLSGLVPGLAVIGARRATPYGLAAAREFAGWASGEGVTIVSGAAVGCDQAAHRAAIDAGGRTVAVMGCGADVDYPRGARDLLATLRRDHAVVAELPWGMQPSRNTFPARNRIISALSSAILVVEAAPRSGTFSTAEAALKSGRDVLIVPGSIYSDTSRGCMRLFGEGATPIIDVTDLGAALHSCDLWDGPAPLERLAHGVPGGMTPVVRRVLEALLADAMRPDDAARALSLDIVTLARVVSALEAQGLVARYPDGRYGPTGRR
jgi:DNA processing protein